MSQVVDKTIQVGICEVCGKELATSERAEMCAKADKQRNFFKNAQPYRGYNITHGGSKNDRGVFAKLIRISSDNLPEMYEAGVDYSFSYMMSHPYVFGHAFNNGGGESTDFTSLSISEAYEQHKLIPSIYKACYHDQQIESLKKIPIEVREEINYVISKARIYELGRLQNLTKEELIKEHIKFAHMTDGIANVFRDFDLIPLDYNTLDTDDEKGKVKVDSDPSSENEIDVLLTGLNPEEDNEYKKVDDNLDVLLSTSDSDNEEIDDDTADTGLAAMARGLEDGKPATPYDHSIIKNPETEALLRHLQNIIREKDNN